MRVSNIKIHPHMLLWIVLFVGIVMLTIGKIAPLAAGLFTSGEEESSASLELLSDEETLALPEVTLFSAQDGEDVQSIDEISLEPVQTAPVAPEPEESSAFPGSPLAEAGVEPDRQTVSGSELLPGPETPAFSSEPAVLSLTYARVVTHHVPVYMHPSDVISGIPPLRWLGEADQSISLIDPRPIYQNDEGWYLIDENEYVHEQDLALYRPSLFQGVTLEVPPDQRFGWLIFDVSPSPGPGAAPAAGAQPLPRYTKVTIYDEQPVGDWLWYQVGQEQWLRQTNLGMVEPSPRPRAVGPAEKWIEVNLYEQTLLAYEGDRLVYATLISSGRVDGPTEQGLWRISSKVKLTQMSGGGGEVDDYFLEDVPWAMYFYYSFGLHAAYWHDRFGLRNSHGCVNLTPRDARWLFEWATPVVGELNWTTATPDNEGTWIWVHAGK